MTSETQTSPTIETLEIQKVVDISASMDIAFEAMLEEIGPEAQMMDGKPMPFKLEAWPGGRWYRDLGKNAGHLWGHVQVFKPPKLLEICGPLMMSYPATNFVQYRFTEEGGKTRLTFIHRGMGFISASDREGMSLGWGHWSEKVRQRAEQKATEKK